MSVFYYELEKGGLMIHYVIFFTDSTIAGGYFTDHWYKKFPGNVPEGDKIGALTPDLLAERGYGKNLYLSQLDSTGFSLEEMLTSNVDSLTAVFHNQYGILTQILRYDLVCKESSERKTL